MDDVDLPRLAGQFVAQILFVIPAVYFASRLGGQQPTSRRLANAALVLGLLVFIAPENTTRLGVWGGPMLRLTMGVVRSAIGVLGLVFVVLAWRQKSDGGIGWGRLVAATFFCLLHMLAGLGMIALWVLAGHASTPQEYVAPDDSFKVMVPSTSWKAVVGKDGTNFVHLVPQMRVQVTPVRQDQSKDDFDRHAQRFREFVEKEPKAKAQIQSLTTVAGDPGQLMTGREETDKGNVFVGHGLVWSRSKKCTFEIVMEGQPKLSSEVGRREEWEFFEKSARTFFQSIE